MKKYLFLSERPVPPVHGCLFRLRRSCRSWFMRFSKRHPRVARIDRATAAAILGVELDTYSRGRGQHLLTAHTAMIRCAGGFRLMQEDEEIDASVYKDARRQIDQIVAALEKMMSGAGSEPAPTSATPAVEPGPMDGKIDDDPATPVADAAPSSSETGEPTAQASSAETPAASTE